MKRQSRHGLSLSVVAMLVLLGIIHQQQANATPEPAIVNPSWSIDFTFENPQPVAFTDGDGNVRWYWYLPYKVTNKTGDDRLFVPEVVIYNDNGQIINADQNVPPAVFNEVKHLLNNPLLKDSAQIVGKLLKGEDFAKESVAIWPAAADEDDVDAFSVFIGGLHGETQTIKNSRTDEDIFLRRTLMLEFEIPGNFKTPQQQPVKLIAQRDIMR